MKIKRFFDCAQNDGGGDCKLFHNFAVRQNFIREGQPLPYDWLRGLSESSVSIARFFASL